MREESEFSFGICFDGSQDTALLLINPVLGYHQGPFTVIVRSYSWVIIDSSEVILYAWFSPYAPFNTYLLFSFWYLHRFPRSSYLLAPVSWHIIATEVFSIIYKYDNFEFPLSVLGFWKFSSLFSFPLSEDMLYPRLYWGWPWVLDLLALPFLVYVALGIKPWA